MQHFPHLQKRHTKKNLPRSLGVNVSPRLRRWLPCKVILPFPISQCKRPSHGCLCLGRMDSTRQPFEQRISLSQNLVQLVRGSLRFSMWKDAWWGVLWPLSLRISDSFETAAKHWHWSQIKPKCNSMRHIDVRNNWKSTVSIPKNLQQDPRFTDP